MNPKTAVRAVSLCSVLVYGVSLGLPALEFQTAPPVKGWMTLLLGWLGLLSLDFPWLANPVYLAALGTVAFSRWKPTQILALTALGLGSLSVFAHEWYFDESQGTAIIRLGSAFYVWMTSFAVLLLGATVARVRPD